MQSSELLAKFENAVNFFKLAKFNKLMERPIKMTLGKFFELVGLWTNQPIKVRPKTFWVEDMLVVMPEAVSLFIYFYGFFEENLTRIFLYYLKPGMTFLDIGSHFGYFTLLGSHLVADGGQVHSFEPTPSTFTILQENAKNKSNITLNNCAVFSQSRSVTFRDFGLRYSAYNSIYEGRLPQDAIGNLRPKNYLIQCITIDDYIEKVNIKPDFIKIDAESSEFEIILGMNKTITKYHPMITIEVGDKGTMNIPRSKELINFLAEKGYSVYECKDGKIINHIIQSDNYKYNNILFLPN